MATHNQKKHKSQDTELRKIPTKNMDAAEGDESAVDEAIQHTYEDQAPTGQQQETRKKAA